MQHSAAASLDVIAHDRYFTYVQPFDGVYFGLARPNAKVCCNALLIDLGGVAVAVDSHSRASAARCVVEFARSRRLEIGYLVNTHHHWDHTQGNSVYADLGARVLAHPAAIEGMRRPGPKHFGIQQPDVQLELDTALELRDTTSGRVRDRHARDASDLQQYLAELPSLRRVLPDEPVADLKVLEGSRRSIRIWHPGQAHTSGDLIIDLPDDEAVATGDCLIAWTPFMGEADPRSWAYVLDVIASGPSSTIFCGHGPLAGHGWLRMFQSYLRDLSSATEASLRRPGDADDRAAYVRLVLAEKYETIFNRHAGHYRPWHTLVLRNAIRMQELLAT